MLILFINAHRSNQEGKLRFNNFYKHIKSLLLETVYYGNEIVENVRHYDELEDYIYDEVTFRTDERVKKKFQSLQYVIIDGSCGFAPWAECMSDLMLIIRNCINSSKKLICHGLAHFCANYYLSTHFDKHYVIGSSKKKQQKKAVDFQHEEFSGDLKLKGVKICNSGVKAIVDNRPFADKSSHAVSKGLTLTSKFQYVVFDSKSGSRLVRDIQSPFSFYWKSKLFCTPKNVTQNKAQVLFETETGSPLAFSYKNLLAVQGLCSQFLKLISNWFQQHTMRQINPRETAKLYQTIAFQNKLQYRKTLSNSASQLRTGNSMDRRPQSSKFSTISFQKPSVRCSGKYQTNDQRYLHDQIKKKALNLGKSRLNFKGNLNQFEIPNFVQRQPSRPPSSHKFREVMKDKWVGGRDFFIC